MEEFNIEHRRTFESIEINPLMKGKMCIIEYNEEQGGFHIQYDTVKQNTFGWITISENILDVTANEFCDYMNAKYPLTIWTNPNRDKFSKFPTIKSVKIEFTWWCLINALDKKKFEFIQIEYDEQGRFNFRPANTIELKHELITNKISRLQCLEFLLFFMKVGAPPKRKIRKWYANEVKLIFQNFLLSDPKVRKQK